MLEATVKSGIVKKLEKIVGSEFISTFADYIHR